MTSLASGANSGEPWRELFMFIYTVKLQIHTHELIFRVSGWSVLIFFFPPLAFFKHSEHELQEALQTWMVATRFRREKLRKKKKIIQQGKVPNPKAAVKKRMDMKSKETEIWVLDYGVLI